MNYIKHYHQLIRNAKFRQLNNPLSKKNEDYFENHHIIPECCEGSNNSYNKVKLLAREHFIAHRLLEKISRMCYGEDHQYTIGLLYAVNSFTMRNASKRAEYKITARTYETIRIQWSKEASKQGRKRGHWKGDKNPAVANHPRGMLGKHHTMSAKNKISQPGSKNGMFGKTHTKEVKEAQSNRAKKMVGELNGFYGKKHTEETLQKIRKARAKQILSNKKQIFYYGKIYSCRQEVAKLFNICSAFLYRLARKKTNKDVYFI